MPHRIFLIWHILGIPVAWISGVSALIGVVTADGIATAITVIGLALVVTLGKLTPALLDFLVKITPALADAFRQVGYALADVKGRMAGEIQENASAIQELQAELVQTRQRAEVAEVKLLELKNATEIGRDGREKDREIIHGAAMAARSASKDNSQEIAELKARLASLESRSNDPDTECP
jgi:hypothetical protein